MGEPCLDLGEPCLDLDLVLGDDLGLDLGVGDHGLGLCDPGLDFLDVIYL